MASVDLYAGGAGCSSRDAEETSNHCDATAARHGPRVAPVVAAIQLDA